MKLSGARLKLKMLNKIFHNQQYIDDNVGDNSRCNENSNDDNSDIEKHPRLKVHVVNHILVVLMKDKFLTTKENGWDAFTPVTDGRWRF